MRRRALLLALGATMVAGLSPISRGQLTSAFPKDVYPDSGFGLPLLKRTALDEQGKKLYDEAR